MMESFFVGAVLTIDDNGLFVTVDLEKTNQELNSLISQIHSEGFSIESITPVMSGVGQFQCGPINQNGTGLTKWLKPSVAGFSYGFGYSYTNGFIVLASQKGKKSKNQNGVP